MTYGDGPQYAIDRDHWAWQEVLKLRALLSDARARVREVEAERDELYRLVEVAQEELRALRPLRDRVLLGALDTLEVRG